MKYSVAFLLVVVSALAAYGHPSYQSSSDLQWEDQTGAQLNEDGRGWRTWSALKDWFRPATNYITQSLPDKTPTEFATDVKESAIDLGTRAQEHPVVQGMSNVVRPVHEWVKEKATDISATSFRDLFNSAVSSVRRADEHVAGWLNSDDPQQENIEILH